MLARAETRQRRCRRKNYKRQAMVFFVARKLKKNDISDDRRFLLGFLIKFR
jgi:hypothetical protein